MSRSHEVLAIPWVKAVPWNTFLKLLDMHATDNLCDNLFSSRIVYILASKKVKYLGAFCCLNMDYL